MYKTTEDFKNAVDQWLEDIIEDDGINSVGYELEYSYREGLDDGTTISIVDETGGEDEGSNLTITYKIQNEDHVVYVKFSGWYQSFVGGEFEQYNFVQPVEKTITVYE